MAGVILVVDDEEANRSLIMTMLRPLECRIVTAADGIEALESFDRNQPDLVLTDVMMPHLNGLEVCRRIKSRPESRLTPVVLITGLTAVEDRVRGLESGADDFIAKPFDASELLARARSLLSLKAFTDELERAESVLLALANSIEGKDPCTEGHCDRLSRQSARLAGHLGLPDEEIRALRIAGVVHDIGKVAVPDAILLKPGPLTPEERHVMQKHPVVGERICEPLKSFRSVLPIIRHHHEKMNGTGYPDGLSGNAIPRPARVLQIVDVYDALTSRRPYKRALPPAQALAVLDEEVARGWWDGEILAAFRTLLDAGAVTG